RRLWRHASRPLPRGAGGRRRGQAGARRHIPRQLRPRQARRELHAARGRRRAEEIGALAGGRRRRGNQAMIIELGHYALVLALVMALLQSSLPLAGAARGQVAWMALANHTAVAQL